jgi:hypothetical protein
MASQERVTGGLEFPEGRRPRVVYGPEYGMLRASFRERIAMRKSLELGLATVLGLGLAAVAVNACSGDKASNAPGGGNGGGGGSGATGTGATGTG